MSFLTLFFFIFHLFCFKENIVLFIYFFIAGFVWAPNRAPLRPPLGSRWSPAGTPLGNMVRGHGGPNGARTGTPLGPLWDPVWTPLGPRWEPDRGACYGPQRLKL